MGQLGVIVSEREAEMLVEAYDGDRDGRVSEQEFVEEISPHSSSSYL